MPLITHNPGGGNKLLVADKRPMSDSFDFEKKPARTGTFN
jgi:hypothetical protein